MEGPTFVKRFRRTERPGVYGRVVQEEHVQAGTEVRLEPDTEATVGVLDSFRDVFKPEHDEATPRRYLAAPTASRDRETRRSKRRR